MRRRTKKGTVKTVSMETVLLSLAGLLIVVGLAWMAYQAYQFFKPDPSLEEIYTEANFKRLGVEIDTMLETRPYFESKTIPFYLSGLDRYSSPFLIVGINPDFPNEPEIEGCENIDDIAIPETCTSKTCLCLCKDSKCSDTDLCKTFNNVRIVGLENRQNRDYGNFGERVGREEVPLEDPLSPARNDAIHELEMAGYCYTWSRGGYGDSYNDQWDSRSWLSTKNLYIEESVGEDGFRYILLAVESDLTELREAQIDRMRGLDPSTIFVPECTGQGPC